MRWLVIDRENERVTAYGNLDDALNSAKYQLGVKYAKQKGKYLYTASNSSKTLYIVESSHLTNYNFNSEPNNTVHNNINKTQILDQIKDIERRRGPGYFITLGSRTSQQFTGTRDYWQFVYEVFYINSNNDVSVSGAINKKYELEEVIDSEIQNIILIKVNVEHIVDGDIMINDTQILGQVKCNKYHQYKHKI